MLKRIRTFRKKRKEESGQVIIEFLIVSMLIFTLIFMFVQISWGIAFGHYAHYATFMAARAYLSGQDSRIEQEEAATEVLTTMLRRGNQDLLPHVARSRAGDDRDITGPEQVPGAMIGMHPEAQGRENYRGWSWAEGVQYNFSVKIFLLPLSSVVSKSGMGQSISRKSGDAQTKSIEWNGGIPFASDAFLGREPTVTECREFLERINNGAGRGRDDGMSYLEDNGC